MEKYQLKPQTSEEIKYLREYVRNLNCIPLKEQYGLLRAFGTISVQQQEIEQLKQWVNDLQSGMYVNCVYCGHRYGPEKNTPVSMADVLKKHIEQCPKHPMSKLKQENEQFRGQIARHKEALEEATETIENIYGRDTKQTENYRDIINNDSSAEEYHNLADATEIEQRFVHGKRNKG